MNSLEQMAKEALGQSIFSYDGGEVTIREDGNVFYKTETGRTVSTSLENLGLSVADYNSEVEKMIENSYALNHNGGDVELKEVRKDGTVIFKNSSGRTVSTSLDYINDTQRSLNDDSNSTGSAGTTDSSNSGNSGGDTIVSGERNPQTGGNANTSFTSQPLTYTIQKGDNIWNISKATGLSFTYLFSQYTNQYNGGVQQSDLSNHMIYAPETIDLQINTEEIMNAVNSINSIIGQLSSLNTAVCGHISDLWNLEAFQILNLKNIFVEYIANTSKSSNTVVSDLGSIISWLNRVVQSSNVKNVSISAEKYTADFTNTSLIIDTKHLDSDTAYSVVFDIDKAQSGISKIKALQSDYDSLKQDWENVKTNLRSYGWSGNNSNAFYVTADEITSELGLLSDNIEKLYSQINSAIDTYENTINSLKY